MANVTLARTNLSVYSKAETDAKYQVIAGDVTPDADNTRSIGSNSLRYADIYAVNFHGVVTQATLTMISWRTLILTQLTSMMTFMHQRNIEVQF